MYCSACHLEYSDPLKFCKQCGRSLVRRAEEPAAASRCCTRCGARVIPGENFCQQCGARLQVRSEDTTIGACAGCSTPWRSAWLYCRTCGTDREHALQFNSAPAPPEQSVPTVTMEAVSAESIAAETFYAPETNPSINLDALVREATGDALRCGRCGAEALPYAQFCEICGASLTSGDLRRGVSNSLNEEESAEEAETRRGNHGKDNLLSVNVSVNAETGEGAPIESNKFQRTVEVPVVPGAGPAAETWRGEVDGGDEDLSLRPTNRIVAPAEATIDTTLSPPEFGHADHADQFNQPDRIDQSTQSDQPDEFRQDGLEVHVASHRDVLSTGAQRTTSIDSPSTIEISAPVPATASDEPLPTGPMGEDFTVNELFNEQSNEQPNEQSNEHFNQPADEPDWELRRDLRRSTASSSSASLDSLSAPGVSAARNRQVALQTFAIGVCVVILIGLVTLIIWQSIARRRAGTDAEPTPAAAPSPAAPSRPEPPEGMVYIPGGTLRLGRDDGDEYERPAHEVRIEPFFMDRTEVANEQYQRFITQTGRAAPSHWSEGQYPAGEASLPVVNVTWEDSAAYAQWAGKRLPTEEEWEYAARGGDDRLYPWGGDWSASRANTRESGRGRIVAVGSYPDGASPVGLLDLIGNVWEWTSSDLRSYEGDGRILADGKVIRGGAWDVPRERATATYRGVVQPDRPYDKTGFRCVKPAP